jgi:hypothetical protein
MPEKIVLCECGCGGITAIAKQTNARYGHVKGQPRRFRKGHNTRRPLADRFWSKVNKNGPLPSAEAVATHPDIAGVCCWIFGSSENLTRYRAMRSGNDYVRAHHVAWFLATGK